MVGYSFRSFTRASAVVNCQSAFAAAPFRSASKAATSAANTYGALYEAFETAEARRLGANLEFHYTPKHASRLNMAELELSVLARQCLARRIPDAATLGAEVAAREEARNRDGVRIKWCFKVADARKKLHRVYPKQTPAADD